MRSLWCTRANQKLKLGEKGGTPNASLHTQCIDLKILEAEGRKGIVMGYRFGRHTYHHCSASSNTGTHIQRLRAPSGPTQVGAVIIQVSRCARLK